MNRSNTISKRDESRNIAEELLQAIEDVKSGHIGATYRVVSAPLKAAPVQQSRRPRSPKN